LRKEIVSNHKMMPIIIDTLKQNKMVSFTVKGTSMRPFFKDNHTIVQLKKFDTYHKGDVVLFQYENQVLLHRIIKIKDDKYMIQGDGAYRKEIVDKDAIYGKVISFIGQSPQYERNYKIWMALRPFRRILLKIVK